jgi:hypothetical protein
MLEYTVMQQWELRIVGTLAMGTKATAEIHHKLGSGLREMYTDYKLQKNIYGVLI